MRVGISGWRYPDWRGLVDRLAAKDVRVLTSVAPSLAVASWGMPASRVPIAPRSEAARLYRANEVVRSRSATDWLSNE